MGAVLLPDVEASRIERRTKPHLRGSGVGEAVETLRDPHE
jgi:hypothetical protein